MTPVPDRDREMILNPVRWPMLALPLKRSVMDYPGENEAVFLPGPSVLKIDEDAAIEIRMCNLYAMRNKNDVPTKKYENVNALLADGWVVD